MYFQPADHMIVKGWGREGPQPALQNIQEFKSPPCAVSPHLEAQPAESGDRGCWLKVERFPTSLPQRALLLLPLLLQLLKQFPQMEQVALLLQPAAPSPRNPAGTVITPLRPKPLMITITVVTISISFCTCHQDKRTSCVTAYYNHHLSVISYRVFF